MHTFTIIGAILVVGITTVSNLKLPSRCTPSSQLLPDVNLNWFNFCDPATGKLSVQKCEYGSGFIRNGTASGCVPFEQWPEKCIALLPSVPKCVGNNLNRPSSATNPNEYYLCTGEGASPLLMSCAEGKGFLNVPGTIGCAEYSIWRSIKNCPE